MNTKECRRDLTSSRPEELSSGEDVMRQGNTIIEAADTTHEQIVALARASPSLPSLRRPSTIACIFWQGGSNETALPIRDFIASSFSLCPSSPSTSGASTCRDRLGARIANEHDHGL